MCILIVARYAQVESRPALKISLSFPNYLKMK